MDHNTNLNKCEKIQVLQTTMFSDHKKIKFKINKRIISGKVQGLWKINYTLLNIAFVQEKVKREFIVKVL